MLQACESRRTPLSDTGGFTEGGRPQGFPQSAFRYDIHVSTEQRFELYLESREVKQRPSRLKADHKVHVAVGGLLAARDGPEKTDVPSPMGGRRGADRVSEFGDTVSKSHDPANL